MKFLVKTASYLSLIIMAISSAMVFAGLVSTQLNATILLVATLTWFITAPMWMGKENAQN